MIPSHPPSRLVLLKSRGQARAILLKTHLAEMEATNTEIDVLDRLRVPVSQSREWHLKVQAALDPVPITLRRVAQTMVTRFRIDYQRWADVPDRTDCVCGSEQFSAAHILTSCPEANYRALLRMPPASRAGPFPSLDDLALAALKWAATEDYEPLVRFCADNSALLW